MDHNALLFEPGHKETTTGSMVFVFPAADGDRLVRASDLNVLHEVLVPERLALIKRFHQEELALVDTSCLAGHQKPKAPTGQKVE